MELKRLPGLYEECALHLDGGSGQKQERTSGGSMPGIPFNTLAANVRSSIVGVLGSWATAVAVERGISAPRRAVAPLAEFLVRHADWLAAHQAAGDVCDEVAQLVRGARRVIDPETRRRVPIGSCVESGCPGDLTAVVRPQRPQVPAEIGCDADASHRWGGHEWLQLSRRIGAAVVSKPAEVREAQSAGAQDADVRSTGGEAVRWVTAADIAALWAIPPGSVYRHASTDKWRRRSLSGRTYYHGTDVYGSLSRRTASVAGR